jgi:hypothetical protein
MWWSKPALSSFLEQSTDLTNVQCEALAALILEFPLTGGMV